MVSELQLSRTNDGDIVTTAGDNRLYRVRAVRAEPFRLIGEPQISAWTPGEMAADLGSVGFVVQEDSGMADWNARFAGGGRAKVERGSYMRITIAAARRNVST